MQNKKISEKFAIILEPGGCVGAINLDPDKDYGKIRDILDCAFFNVIRSDFFKRVFDLNVVMLVADQFDSNMEFNKLATMFYNDNFIHREIIPILGNVIFLIEDGPSLLPFDCELAEDFINRLTLYYNCRWI